MSWTADPEYQLVWPHDLLHHELSHLVATSMSVDAYVLLFEEAFAGQQPLQDLRHMTRDDVWRDSASTWSSVGATLAPAVAAQLGRRILDALDDLPPYRPRQYWAARQRSEPEPRPGDRNALQLGWQGVMLELVRGGYLDRAAGDDCSDTAGTRDDRIRDLIGGRAGLDAYLWIGEEPWRVRLEDGEFYTLVEVMHDLVARPRTYVDHNYCGGRHYDNFDRLSGQAVYRWRVNDLFDRYQIGFRLAEHGEDTGLLAATVVDSRQALLNQVEQHVPDDNADKVGHAVALFRNRTATDVDKRLATRELADVLEDRRKTVLKEHLTRKDEGDLFNIANNFALRHHEADQMYDYDPIFLDWIFWWYLATVELSNRLITRETA